MEAGDSVILCMAKEVESGPKSAEVGSDRDLEYLERALEVPLLEEAEPVEPVPAGPSRHLSGRGIADLVGLVTLVAGVAFLWGRAAAMSLWIDEGISMGVVAHPLSEIPHLVVGESSPPLYYVLLHGWISLMGDSNTAVHALSLLFALAIVPAALWAGWSLFGRRTGWICALVVAINPFVAYYATETRMYSMVVLLALLASATFLHAFVFGRRKYLPWFVVSLTLLLYTHNWGLFLGLGAAAGLLASFVINGGRRRRRLVIDAALGFGGVALLYAPWLPSLAHQVRQHLQPWASKANLVSVRDDVVRWWGATRLSSSWGWPPGSAW